MRKSRSDFERRVLAELTDGVWLVPVQIMVGDNCTITRLYDNDDPIWKLSGEKRRRKALADTARDISIYADELTMTKVTVRG